MICIGNWSANICLFYLAQCMHGRLSVFQNAFYHMSNADKLLTNNNHYFILSKIKRFDSE